MTEIIDMNLNQTAHSHGSVPSQFMTQLPLKALWSNKEMSSNKVGQEVMTAPWPER